MKSKLEKLALSLILAPLAPIAGLLGFWWTSYALLPEKWIPFFAVSGLLLGLLADVFVLKQLVSHAYEMRMIYWIVIFLFYTLGVFGFFMGMPVLNAVLAIPAGFIVGGKLAQERTDRIRVRNAALQTCLFTTGVLAFICIVSAVLALNETTLPVQLEGMLALPFTVTWRMIWGLILTGGAGLLAVNWGLAALSVRLTYRFLSTP